MLCRYRTEKGQEEKLRDRRGDTAIISSREDGGWAHLVAVEVARKDDSRYPLNIEASRLLTDRIWAGTERDSTGRKPGK